MGLRGSGDCSHESSVRAHLHLTFIASGAAHDLLSPGLDLGVRGWGPGSGIQSVRGTRVLASFISFPGSWGGGGGPF